ncbi:GNAT family N-acetyltransferase [Paracoccus albus]|uniref:GNAT family N-acetyltransferase n=1 Tax=Paracoccus albus TaxID=3017784 RepID=UPI0022EFEA6B|nr:GNAT family N-acetyltransferase [Paracoccus albus]WBU61233.1 GNAT family N-acetyltransferase [Paracoccus albus]
MIRFRRATRADVPAIVAMLTDDVLGKDREVDDLSRYLDAFEAMEQEASNTVYVGVQNGHVVATYQLTIISGLSLSASRRAQIEAVRVDASLRGQGAGAALIADAEERARLSGATLMQLTTNASRKNAHRFYEKLGYEPSHIGYKKPLQGRSETPPVADLI